MTTNEAFQQLQNGGTVNCVTPDGVRFQIQSKLSYGIPWYRSFPARRGCLNRYSRLSDSELRQWLESVTIQRQGAIMKCKHCGRLKENHWTDADNVYLCSSADLPDYKLFSDIVSDVQFEASEDEQ